MTSTAAPRGTRRLLWLVALVWLAGCDAGEDPDETAAPGGETVDVDPSFSADEQCFGFEPAGFEPGEVECGTVQVPLHHDEPEGPTIDLATVVLAGSDADAYERPLLLLGGGPGEALVETALTVPEFGAVFDVGPDLIVIDQRGAGSSEPALECPELPDIEPQATVAEDVEVALEALGTCHRSLVDEGIDLDAFDHLQNARDVDVVRRALGHDQLDVRGASYGTQVALLAAEANPEGIGSMVLSSPIDPTENWVEGSAAGLAGALERMSAACDTDSDCSGVVGELDTLLVETSERLGAEPEEVTVTTPTGEEVTTTYTPSVLIASVVDVFYLGDAVALLPALIARAHEGDLQPLATISAILGEQVEATISTGMQFSMTCSGEAGLFDPDASLGRFDDELIEQHWFPGAPIGGAPTTEACEVWDVEQSYDPEAITLGTETPTLVVTGAFDHVTPPRLGRQVAESLPTSHLVEVPVTGHGPLEALGACGRQLVSDFLADPDTAPDAGCATEIPLRLQTELPPGLG